jgi:hypothetical protein
MDLDEISLFKNKVNRNNFIAVCFLWSSSGFINYLLVYYSKYFQGNFFFNYSFQGGSEGLGLIWIGILTRWFNVVSMIRVVGILIVWFALIQLALMNYLPSHTHLFLFSFCFHSKVKDSVKALNKTTIYLQLLIRQ